MISSGIVIGYDVDCLYSLLYGYTLLQGEIHYWVTPVMALTTATSPLATTAYFLTLLIITCYTSAVITLLNLTADKSLVVSSSAIIGTAYFVMVGTGHFGYQLA